MNPHYIQVRDPSTPWGFRVWDGVEFVEFGGKGYSEQDDAIGAWHLVPRDVRELNRAAHVVGPHGGKHYLQRGAEA